MIAFYATREHYVSHLAPIWRALADREVPFFTPSVPAVLARADACGVPATVGRPPDNGLLVAAASVDLGSYRRCVLVEHGAGQSYRGLAHHSWSGGDGRQNVVLFVVPNQWAWDRNEGRYPDAEQIICAPYVEHLRTLRASEIETDWYEVILGRHWDSYLAPELSSAWAHHFDRLRRFGVMNANRTAFHFHPRCEDVGRTLAREWGCRYLDTFDDAVRLAPHGVLVVDNSSAGFEWAALDRPVVWLNAPHYRRGVEHGLRFWSHVDVGVQVDDPARLEAAIADSLRFDPYAEKRRDLIGDVFPVVEGSARIAADAIRRYV